MKKIKVFIVFLIVVICINFIPIDIAVSYPVQSDREYILVQQVKTTGIDWYMIEASKQESLKGYVHLNGNAPPSYDMSNRLYHPENVYVCYGQFEQDMIVDGEQIMNFNVQDWDFVYPIKRNSLLPGFLNPKYGRNFLDYLP